MTAVPAESEAASPSPAPRASVRLVPVPRVAPESVRRGAAGLRLAPAEPAQPRPDPTAFLTEPDDEPDPGGLDHLPDPRRWSALLAQAVVEILAGRRPAGQVVRWTDRDVFERIARSAPRRAERVGGTPVRVRRVRVSTSVDGTVEAVAVVDDGTRCRALAMRLEGLQRRWLCTALDIV